MPTNSGVVAVNTGSVGNVNVGMLIASSEGNDGLTIVGSDGSVTVPVAGRSGASSGALAVGASGMVSPVMLGRNAAIFGSAADVTSLIDGAPVTEVDTLPKLAVGSGGRLKLLLRLKSIPGGSGAAPVGNVSPGAKSARLEIADSAAERD